MIEVLGTAQKRQKSTDGILSVREVLNKAVLQDLLTGRIGILPLIDPLQRGKRA